MSLNGLEATEVNEAYQSALGEGGGWFVVPSAFQIQTVANLVACRFLLKYTNRDEVALYEKGSGGLAEAKEAVNRYKEQSPLFGFIQYRRRKVILKYIPEGISRLLQGKVLTDVEHELRLYAEMTTARVTVQFQSVAEKFNPYDTIFTFATPSDLRDSDLSSACSLHTASASVKSSNESLPQQGLVEITEDVSESPMDKEHNGKGVGEGEEHRPNSLSEKLNRRASAGHHHSTSPSVTTRNPQRSRTSRNTDKDLLSTPGKHLGEETGPRAILDYMGFDTGPSVEGRVSSQSARPSTRDMDNAYQYKLKVKLGPRPSIDSSILRSDKSDGVGSFRPVSTLPAGLRMPPRKVVSGRPKSSQAQSSFSDRKSSRQPLPPVPITPIQIPDRKIPIPNNGLSTPAKTPEPKSLKMTPEKRRLMKALQIRQKQLEAQKPFTGLGIDSLPAEEGITKPESDDSIQSGIPHDTTPPAESDLVHVSIRDLNKEEHRNLEASPISIPETCEGPSTQASSITEEEEIMGQKTQESIAEPELTTLKKVDLSTVNETEDPHDQSNGRQINNSEEQGDEADLTKEVIPTKSHQDSPQPSLPTEQSLLSGNEQALSKQNSGKEPQASVINDPPMPIYHPPSTDEKVSTVCVNEEEAVLPNETSVGVEKVPEQSIQIHDTSSPQDSHDETRALEAPEPLGAPAVPMESFNAHEVPLPPVDEDEEFSLSPHQATLQAAPPNSESSLKPETKPLVATSMDNHQSQDSDLTATQRSSSNTIDGQHTERRVRRQGVVPPIHRLSSVDHSEEQFLSDESFMEELKSATLQEAKPVSVSKSPIKPVFSRTESEQRLVETRAFRSVSSPLTPPSRDEEVVSSPPMPTPMSSRSFSATQPTCTDTQQAIPPLPKKIGVSTGISQRIKALEQLSGCPTSPLSQASSPNGFAAVRKTSQQTPPTASVPGRGNNSKSRPGTAYPSPSSSPETIKVNPFKQFNDAGSSRPESVSVTATIVRDAKNKKREIPRNLSEPRTMDLHQSPLVVEHRTMGPPPLSPLEPPRPRYASTRSGSVSSTDQKGELSPTKPSPTRRRDSFASVRSKSSRAASENELPRTISNSSMSGATTPDGTRDEKKDSKRSRLMKRMSNISSMSRRSIAQALSPSPKESPIMEHHEPIREMPPSSVEVGDVNVQFPDTLVSSASSTLLTIGLPVL